MTLPPRNELSESAVPTPNKPKICVFSEGPIWLCEPREGLRERGAVWEVV